MRSYKEVEDEIEFVNRQMTQLVIQQSDIDDRLKSLDKRIAQLQHELEFMRSI